MPRLVLGRVAVVARPSRDIGFNTDDWFNASRFGCLVKINRSAKSPVVGNRARFHAEFLHPRYKIGNFRETIKQAVVSVIMEMHVIRWLQNHPC